ncbi:hypothetical protein SESBI_02832 [Sesbania bispinosa]|nr:hypothetical protein SESBI_02832 [Sesbania bispinosa]
MGSNQQKYEACLTVVTFYPCPSPPPKAQIGLWRNLPKMAVKSIFLPNLRHIMNLRYHNHILAS